ncbi:hypothetical protein [Priestia filamentosa]|uniref:hypothetical protein n=1 Tax=Priestia filamentosa TaxID=1402861 RepID=UPI003981E82E
MGNQIIISLILIMFCYISLQIFTLYYLKNKNRVKGGPMLGDTIRDIEVIDINKNKINLSKILSSQPKLIIFVDMNCAHCKNIINSLNVFNKDLLKDIHFFLVNNEENVRELKKRRNNKNFYFLNEEDVFDNFNVRLFPFYMELNGNKIVQKKGYASGNTIIEYLT